MILQPTPEDWHVIEIYLGKRPTLRQRTRWNAVRRFPGSALADSEFIVKTNLLRIQKESRGNHGNA